MSRVRVQVYGNGKSKSGRLLAQGLGVLRLKVDGSRFVGKNTDVIVNWGLPKNILPNVRYLNPIDSVKKALNKAVALETLDRAGVSVPKTYDTLLGLPQDTKLFARTILNAHSGKGIIVGTRRELDSIPVYAPLYTQYIDKKFEYRVIVVDGKVIDTKKKKKKVDWEETRDEHVWNHGNGYVFTRNVGSYNFKLPSLAVDALNALGLMYGAVDIIEDIEGNLYVLEVNTAFGIEGTTQELVCNAIKELL